MHNDYSSESQRRRSKSYWGDQVVRFWNSVKKGESGECWIWIRHKAHCGYGEINFDGKQQRAHRVSWQIHNGPIPDGMCVLHKCDNPPCVNPDHLFIGTKKQNTQDMMEKKRNKWTTHCGSNNKTAKFSEKDVLHIREVYAKGLFNQSELARKFRVKPAAIWGIVHRLSWKHC